MSENVRRKLPNFLHPNEQFSDYEIDNAFSAVSARE